MYLNDRNGFITHSLSLQLKTPSALKTSGHAEYDARIYTEANSKQEKPEDSENISQTAVFPTASARVTCAIRRMPSKRRIRPMAQDRWPSNIKCRQSHDALPEDEKEINMQRHLRINWAPAEAYARTAFDANHWLCRKLRDGGLCLGRGGEFRADHSSYSATCPG
jgi:hypothetical protein